MAAGTVDGFTKEFNKLLAQAANGLEQSSVAKEFGRIARDFNKALEGAEEKIQLAEHCNQIVERQMKRLDIEVRINRTHMQRALRLVLIAQPILLPFPASASASASASFKKAQLRIRTRTFNICRRLPFSFLISKIRAAVYSRNGPGSPPFFLRVAFNLFYVPGNVAFLYFL